MSETQNSIIIVDDEPANIFLMEGLLKSNGYKCFSCSNGLECLELLQTFKPSLILLDIMMPEISGIQVLQQIVSNEEIQDIKVIMVSAITDSDEIKKSLDIGAIDYVRKPIDETELMARINSALKIKTYEDELKEMIKSKQDFINIISHDLRTPFASITGFAQMLRQDPELMLKMNNDHKEFLDYIISSSEFLVDYFNKLLSWANIGSKKINLKLSESNVYDIVNTSFIIYRHKINVKNIDFINEIDTFDTLVIDKTYFSQAINNLISNAIKYTPNNGEIRIYRRKTDEYYRVYISDSGIGIEDFSEEEYFNKSFHKSRKGTKGEKGTGTGLYICKKIIDAHGFQLSCKSKVNEGTIFSISVPL